MTRVHPLEKSVLVIMAKQPLVGSTKTRLSPPLAPFEAAQLYEALLKDTIDLCSKLNDIHLAAAVTPSEAIGYFSDLAPEGTILLPVDCPNIGICLQSVIGTLLDDGFKKVLALNSDGPSLPKEYIYQAERYLELDDIVLGPGEDGGYYLIGLKQLHDELFRGIEWSTSQVFPQTLAKVKTLGLKAALLPEWYDVDTWDDLLRLKNDLKILPENRLPNTRFFFSKFKPKNRPE